MFKNVNWNRIATIAQWIINSLRNYPASDRETSAGKNVTKESDQPTDLFKSEKGGLQQPHLVDGSGAKQVRNG